MALLCSTDEFLELARKSGAIDAAALSRFTQRLAVDSNPPSNAQQLAQRAVRDGLFTLLQANLLLRGKWRNFLICGKYKLLEHLGTGGMGQVFLCEHIRMRRRVAIKVLSLEGAENGKGLQRFFREAEAVGKLNHPNIVRAYDIDHDGRHHFLVMEYVDGSSLFQIVKGGGPLPILRACHYIRQAALGLQHAHEAGWVHRDIKPGNLLVDRSGLVKVLDLGLARFLSDAGNLTGHYSSRNLIGTVDYLAPEQLMNSHAADIRADIYSLGVTFYFLLTGRSPYRGGTIAEKLLSHQMQSPEPVKSLRVELPDDLAGVVHRMLVKDPADRFQTPTEVVQALDSWTEVPIPPPPECEMPQLSRAARLREPARAAIPLAIRSTLRAFQKAKTTRNPAPTPSAAPTRFKAFALVLVATATVVGFLSWFVDAKSKPIGKSASNSQAETRQDATRDRDK